MRSRADALSIHRPAGVTARDVGVVLCPGGGYGRLALGHEGADVVEWLTGLGITVGLLRYPVAETDPTPLHPGPLEAAQDAVRSMRAGADELGISPDKIGIIGFSAGGHVAGAAATNVADGVPGAAEPADRVGSRPDFAILIYPVVTLLPPYAHAGSRENLVGERPSESLTRESSNEQRVKAGTPPMFLVHTTEDVTVHPENSIMLYQALVEAGVPAELHIFQSGRHGLGLGPADPPFAAWPALCVSWLQANGFW